MTDKRATLQAQLEAAVGKAQVLTAAADTAPYLTDWRGRYHGRALAIVRPGTTAEVAAVVRACLETATPLVPQGGNTGHCGGATPDASGEAVLLCLTRLNRMRAVDPANGTLTVEAGMTLAAKQLFIGAEGTLGIVTAAVLKLFAAPRTRATALVAVADVAAAVTLLGELKQALGDRLVGFELISAFALALSRKHGPRLPDPLPGHPWYALVEAHDSAADAPLAAMVEQALGTVLEAGTATDAALAQSGEQAALMWELRENIAEAQRCEGPNVKHDISLPVSAIPAFLAEAAGALEHAFPGLRFVTFGHLGDGNLHYNLAGPESVPAEAFMANAGAINRIVHDLVAAHGGSISAEHGIGQMKTDELVRYKSAVEIELMQRIKSALDPTCLLNPGKVLRQGAGR